MGTIGTVGAERRSRARQRRRRVGAGLLAGVAVMGGTGAGSAGGPPAPGPDTVTVLADSAGGTFTGSSVIELGPAPAGATHISVSLTCLSADMFTFETGSTAHCTTAGGDPAGAVVEHVPLTPGMESVEIRTENPQARWRATATFTDRTPTAPGVNRSGQTYGTGLGLEWNERPDLIAVTATSGVHGYAYAGDLEPPGISSPEEALAWQEASRGLSFSVPVYESDGETVIGEFTWEGPPDLTGGN